MVKAKRSQNTRVENSRKKRAKRDAGVAAKEEDRFGNKQ